MATPAAAVAETPLMLSVSGVRGIVGGGMTPPAVSGLAAAFGSCVLAAGGERHPLVIVGRDSRPSGEMLAAAAVAGLTAVGARVIDCGVIPTPTVGVMIARRGADGGLVVTASHNPESWNGIKFLNAAGAAPPPDEAAEIFRRYREGDIDWAPVHALRSLQRDETAVAAHVERVLDHVDPAPIRAARFRVVVDSVNGAGGGAACLLLESLGCEVVHLNAEPTGRFAHVPEPTEEHLGDLALTTRSAHAACGFAQDPDADRLAIIDDRGRYIGEEYTLALAAREVLRMRGAGALAANLATSRMIDDVAACHGGGPVLRTAVGEAHVVAAMQASGAVVGGEGNGGVIFPPVTWVRDSLSAMALVLGLLAAEKRSLGALVDAMPRYVLIKRRLDLDASGGRARMDEAIEAVARRYRSVKGAAVNRTDGVRVDFAGGWVLLRPSNTEPIARIFAEAETEARAEELLAEVSDAAGLPPA